MKTQPNAGHVAAEILALAAEVLVCMALMIFALAVAPFLTAAWIGGRIADAFPWGDS